MIQATGEFAYLRQIEPISMHEYHLLNASDLSYAVDSDGQEKELESWQVEHIERLASEIVYAKAAEIRAVRNEARRKQKHW